MSEPLRRPQARKGPRCSFDPIQIDPPRRTETDGFSSIEEMRPVLRRIEHIEFLSLTGQHEVFKVRQPVSPGQPEKTMSWRSGVSEDGDEVHLIRILPENRFVLVHTPLLGPARPAIEIAPAEAGYALMTYCPEEHRPEGVPIICQPGRVPAWEKGAYPPTTAAGGTEMEQGPEPAPQPATSDPALALDDRAVALFSRWGKEELAGQRGKIRLAALAKALEVHRSSLYDEKVCKTFVSLWKAYQAKPRPESRGRRKARPYHDDD